MARGDGGSSRHVGNAAAELYRKNEAEFAGKAQKQARIEVGDFVSELAQALRYREVVGQSEGDWLEEPERAYTDGQAFGTEINGAAHKKLQIALVLDASRSMWKNRIMESASAAWQAMDAMLRQAQQELPEGTLTYAPFIFHEYAFKVPRAFMKYVSYVGGVKSGTRKNQYGQFNAPEDARDILFIPSMVPGEAVIEAINDGEIDGSKVNAEWHKKHKLSGHDTNLSPLLRRIQEWEAGNDANAVRLDLVITDGVFENERDVESATNVQAERNGNLSTVLLNFLKPAEWGQYHLPNRCCQYAGTNENLTPQLRTILEEVVARML